MNMKRMAVALFASILLAAPGAFAASKIKVGTFPIPLMVESENKGVFVDLAGEISKRVGQLFEISVMPPQRTVEDFLGGKLDVMFPALDVMFPPDKTPLKTKELIYVKEDFAFTKKGSPMLKSIGDLEGRTVGVTLGYPYVRELMDNAKIKFDKGNTDEANAQKLAAGRFDAFVVEEKSGLQAFKKTGTEGAIQYDPKTPLSRQDVYFAVGKGNPALAEKISRALAEMKSDGTFAKIMSRAK